MAEPLQLPTLSEEPPAGPSLELDPAFGEMERAAQGKAESQFGNTVEAATPPDWREAATLAEALLDRTRDLRVMVLLATARINLGDLVSFARVLSTVRQHLETMWEHVHPQLDPEDEPPNDPTQRANALQQLTDAGRMLRPLRDLPLAAPPRKRPVTWRDLAILSGALEAEAGRERMTDAAVRGTFAETDPARLTALRDAVSSVLADVKGIGAAFDANAGFGVGPDLDPLTKLVFDIGNELSRFQGMAGEGGAADDAPGADEADDAPEAAGGGAETAGGGAAPRASRPARSFASIRNLAMLDSRDDALHALTLAAAYFRLNEPSSPVPLLIDRAARLVPMPFLDILRDLAPDGLLQAQMIAGSTGEEQ